MTREEFISKLKTISNLEITSPGTIDCEKEALGRLLSEYEYHSDLKRELNDCQATAKQLARHLDDEYGFELIVFSESFQVQCECCEEISKSVEKEKSGLVDSAKFYDAAKTINHHEECLKLLTHQVLGDEK